jgi:hypothetical protein
VKGVNAWGFSNLVRLLMFWRFALKELTGVAFVLFDMNGVKAI